MTIAEQLNRRLFELGIRPIVLADALGLRLGTIHRWTHGHCSPSVSNAKRLESLLGMPGFAAQVHPVITTRRARLEARYQMVGREPVSLSAVVRLERHRCGLTQRELATLSGVSVHTIRSVEAGRRPQKPAAVRKLADALGAPLDVRAAWARSVDRSAKPGTVRFRRLRLAVTMQAVADVAGVSNSTYRKCEHGGRVSSAVRGFIEEALSRLERELAEAVECST